MNASKRFECERFEFRLNADGSATGSGVGWAAGFDASGKTRFTPDPANLDDGIIMSCMSGDAEGAAGSASASLNIPALSVSEGVSYGTFQASIHQTIEIDDLQIYRTSGDAWKVKWSELRWYVGGGLEYTHGAIDLDSTILTPASIPLFGVPFRVQAGATAAVEFSETPPLTATGECTTVGGWRFKPYGGSYVALPVTLPDIEYATAGCCEAEPDAPSCSADDTWTGTVSAQHSVEYSESILETIECCSCPPDCECSQPSIDNYIGQALTEATSGGAITLIPDLTKRVQRINDDDYAALIYRGALPYAKARAGVVCFTGVPPPPGPLPEDSPDYCSASDVTTLHPSHSEFLGTVLNAEHVIEEPFALTTYCPVELSASIREDLAILLDTIQARECLGPGGFGECPTPPGWVPDCPEPPDMSGSLHVTNQTFDFPEVESAGLDYLDHAEGLARYINYNCSPHWSFFYWFPPDEADESVQWPVDGGDAFASEYWSPLRTQWLSHPALPSEDNRETRNSLISAPLSNGHYTWFDTIVGSRTSNWGVSSPMVQTPAVADIILDEDSEDLWSADTMGFEGTLTFGPTGITIAADPPGAGAKTVIVEFDMGSFTTEPYQFPHIADSILLDWDPDNITSLLVEVVSEYDDVTKEIGDTPDTYVLPRGRDKKYAGSWALDMGQGVVTDLGADSKTSGRSSASMGGAETSFSLNLIKGQLSARLRFTVELTDGTDDALLKWPRLKVSNYNAKIVQEHGHHSCTFWQDGPGVRFGQWEWYDIDLDVIRVTPNLPDPGAPPLRWHASAIDGLCYKRVALLGLGAEDGLTTEIASLFDSEEGQSYLAVDTHTIAFLMPGGKAGRLVLVNGLETPPLACFPLLGRDADLAETTDYEQATYSFVQEPRRHVTAGNIEVNLYTPGGTLWTASDPSRSVSGWKVTKHSHAVDNTEDGFLVKQAGTKCATMRPWHGNFSVISAPVEGTGPSYDVGLGMDHWRAFIGDDGFVRVGTAGNDLDWVDNETEIEADHICLRVHRDSKAQTAILMVDDAGAVSQYTSPDGLAWTLAASLGSGTYPQVEVSRSGVRYLYWIDGGDVTGEIRGADNTLLTPVATAIAGVDDDGLAVAEYVGSEGAWGLLAAVVVSGSITLYSSPDGVAWSSVASVATGKFPALAISADGLRYLYWLDGADIKGKIYGADMTDLEDASPIPDIDDAPFGADESSTSGGALRIAIETVVGGEITEFTSREGVTFT